MSTNFYGRKIPIQKDLENISSYVLSGAIFLAKEMIEDYEPIHIGKQSCGWKFLFNANGFNYFNDITSLRNWLKSVVIYDENNKTISFDDFWKSVEQNQNQKTHGEQRLAINFHVIENFEFLDCEFS